MKRPVAACLMFIALLLAIIAAWMVSIRPWQSKIIAKGFSPNGREYCVVQTFKGFTEPYQVSFYIPDAQGIWRWNYLEHEDNGWKTATVKFAGSSALIERNGLRFKEIKIPCDQVDLKTVLPGYRDKFCDKHLSAEEVFTFHNQKYT